MGVLLGEDVLWGMEWVSTFVRVYCGAWSGCPPGLGSTVGHGVGVHLGEDVLWGMEWVSTRV